MNRKAFTFAALLPVLCFAGFFAPEARGQAATAPFAFRTGQSLYIVAFRRFQQPMGMDPSGAAVNRPDFLDNDLDAERKVRKELEKWGFFRVTDKPSEANFILLVNLEDSSLEALAIPPEAYRLHYKEDFDLDELREAAHGRYGAGPLKLPTLGRLIERMIKQFRAEVERGRAQVR